MKNFLFYIIFFTFFINSTTNSNEMSPSKLDYEQVINIGKMKSHDNKFTLYFRTREKAVLTRGVEFNYIIDFPQDLYYLRHDTGKIFPLITYDWFPKKIKELGSSYDLPIFPEDFAYYLLNDNQTLILVSGIKSIKSNYKYNIKNGKLETLPKNKWVEPFPKKSGSLSKTKYVITIFVFILSIISITLIKNETKSLQKEINNLEASIKVLKLDLHQETLDHEVITSPEKVVTKEVLRPFHKICGAIFEISGTILKALLIPTPVAMMPNIAVAEPINIILSVW